MAVQVISALCVQPDLEIKQSEYSVVWVSYRHLYHVHNQCMRYLHTISTEPVGTHYERLQHMCQTQDSRALGNNTLGHKHCPHNLT